ncbi:hypothetical protein [Aquimarina sp. 2201CG5-10]|uniref:RHS repeat protein n=1 Tax=Aquimarina callyspongiae TaxID=3098150 RepID=UPI002AB37E4C|nr:hypothetical protein [Aquimarina sp. 2201CG5-10]MDY8137214.1 hypothetical protein [Aquimarina sp. 2201CG5-10]
MAQDLPDYAPVSPTAASIGKFGTFPVNTNLGTTNISIPLYTIKQGGIEIPIGLSYNAVSGIRVNEEASWVGLGWTLNAGGAIVRNVKGQPGSEDIPELGSILDYTLENYTYLYNVYKGRADTAQDEYLFNYSGLSGKFYYDQNKQDFVFSDYKPIKITGYDNDFKAYPSNAILENGQKLEFYETETIDRWAPSTLENKYRKYITTSYLSRVVSANLIDEVTFEYDEYTFEKGKEITGDNISVCGILTNTNNWTSPPANPSISSPFDVIEKSLRKINFKNGYVLFDYSMDRIDSDSPKLNNISVYSLVNGISKLIKQITFNYSYYNRFGGKTYSTSIPGYDSNKYNKSLKLDRVEVYPNNSNPEIYRFEYNNTQLSSRNSSGQDFWGYANNNSESFVHKRNATLYFPSVTTPTFAGTSSLNAEIGFGNRNPDEEKTKAGILTRIYYPTGGYTDFEYEANKYLVTNTIPTYERKSAFISSQGAQGGSPPHWCSPTGLQNTSFSPVTKPYNAKIEISFSDALGGLGDESYVEFNGTVYQRNRTNPPTLPYLSTIISEDVTLYQGNNYTIEAWEKGIGTNGAAGCPFVTARVSWDELTGSTTETVEKLVGGLRVKSITSYDGTNPDFLTKKEFDYTTPSLLIPIVYEDYQTINYPDCTNSFSSHPSYALNINGGPSVEYKKVTEYNYDHSRKDNGKIVYEYEPTPSDRIIGTGPGSGSMFNIFVHPDHYPCVVGGVNITQEWPYVTLLRTRSYGNFSNYYTKSWASGSLKKQEFYKRNADDSYTLLRSIENNYTTVDESSLAINYVKATFGSNTFGPSPSVMDRCGLQAFANNSFIYNTGFYSFGKKLLTSSKETIYNTDGANPVVVENSYVYNNPDYFQTASTIKNSNGEELRTSTYYPSDVGVLSGLTSAQQNTITRLQESDLHKIGTPIQVESYKKEGSQEILLSRQRTLFKDWGGNLILPEVVQLGKSNDALQDRVEYLDYDNHGNPLEVSKADGSHISYIWGYNQEYPIAKVENATRSEIEALSGFGANFHTGVTGLTNTQENTLRTDLPNAMVTTYTYDPLIGVTSITDPRGYTIYYQYDQFNRLQYVKDADGNLVSENQYNYKN